MKCELCHERPAETVLKTVRDGEEDELYVCRACADAERVKRQKRSQRTRKASGPATTGVSISVTGGEPPPFLSAIFDAISGIVGDIEQKKNPSSAQPEPETRERPFVRVPLGEVSESYILRDRLHLEGLFLIGEIDAVRRAAEALELRLVGLDADGVRDTGHVYSLERPEAATADRAAAFLEALVEQEKNARVRLFEEMPRVFGDSLCRALAILKNCRLLASGELFDLLSPLRLAAIEKMLDGITRVQLERLLAKVDLSGKESDMPPEERDRVDAERADEMNARFEDVVLNERAEEKFL